MVIHLQAWSQNIISNLYFFNSIVWLQNQRDQNAERTRGGGIGMGVGRGPGFGGRDDFHEFRVGRIKHERVKVRKIPSPI